MPFLLRELGFCIIMTGVCLESMGVEGLRLETRAHQGWSHMNFWILGLGNRLLEART